MRPRLIARHTRLRPLNAAMLCGADLATPGLVLSGFRSLRTVSVLQFYSNPGVVALGNATQVSLLAFSVACCGLVPPGALLAHLVCACSCVCAAQGKWFMPK